MSGFMYWFTYTNSFVTKISKSINSGNGGEKPLPSGWNPAQGILLCYIYQTKIVVTSLVTFSWHKKLLTTYEFKKIFL